MKKLKILLPGILVLVTNLFALDTLAVKQTFQSISDEVKQQYCPDKRTAVYDVKLRLSNDTAYVFGATDNKAAREELVAKVASINDVVVSPDVKLFPEEGIGEKSFGMAENSVLTLRSKPSIFEDVLTQTLRGLPMEVLTKENGFYLLRTDDGYLGWGAAERVHIATDELKKRWETSPKVVYTDLEGMVYSEKSKKSQPVADVVMGNRFIVLEKTKKWTKVEFPDEVTTGWLYNKEITDFDEYMSRTPEVDKIISTAYTLMGRPYFWGGASPKMLDCSGFVQTIFRQHGLVLLRDASMQVHQGSAVDTSGNLQQLKAGDLLFFGPRPGKITHVGLYLGDYSYIHCSGKVKINSFDVTREDFSSYRYHSLRAVRRIIQE